MLLLWLLVPTIQNTLGNVYRCGDLEFLDNVECLCGNHTILESDSRGCCGGGECHYEPDVRGVCSEGTVCSTNLNWPCGDIRISWESKCQCGSETLGYSTSIYPGVADKYYDAKNAHSLWSKLGGM